jgi:hypothetical protein
MCGRVISEETKSAVEKLVRENGLTAVTTAKHLPEELKGKAKGSFSEIKHGSGSYICVKSFLSSRLKKRVKPFLGKNDEIRLTFGGREIRLKISDDGNTINQI